MIQVEESSGRNGKSQLILLIGIALLATVVPYLMYFTGWGVPTVTTNQGIMISNPVVMSNFDFEDARGQRWLLAEQKPKFRLLIPVQGECAGACRESLYLSRQVRRRLAEKSEQLERIYVQLGTHSDAEFRDYLAAEHSDIVYLRGDYQQWRNEVAALPELQGDFDGSEYYLLHRYGALGLAYNSEHSGNQLLDDLEFLIRTSN